MAYSLQMSIFSNTKFEPPQSARTVEEHADHVAWDSVLKSPCRHPPKNKAQMRNQVPHYESDPRNLALTTQTFRKLVV